VEVLTGPKNPLAAGLAEGDSYWDGLTKHSGPDTLEFVKDPAFDPTKLFYLWTDAYLWYRFREDTPLSPTYSVGYIGGVTNGSFHLEKATQILKKNHWVSKVTPIQIPYYNAEAGNTRAVEFSVKLPQEEHDKLVRYYRDEKKQPYWSVRVKGALATPYNLAPFDILGLQAALKTEAEAELAADKAYYSYAEED